MPLACPNCFKQFTDALLTCPHCGYVEPVLAFHYFTVPGCVVAVSTEVIAGHMRRHYVPLTRTKIAAPFCSSASYAGFANHWKHITEAEARALHPQLVQAVRRGVRSAKAAANVRRQIA